MIDDTLCKLFTLQKKNTFNWIPNLDSIPLPTRNSVDFYRREIQGQPHRSSQAMSEDISVEEVFVMLNSFIDNIRDHSTQRRLNYFSSLLEREIGRQMGHAWFPRSCSRFYSTEENR